MERQTGNVNLGSTNHALLHLGFLYFQPKGRGQSASSCKVEKSSLIKVGDLVSDALQVLISRLFRTDLKLVSPIIYISECRSAIPLQADWDSLILSSRQTVDRRRVSNTGHLECRRPVTYHNAGIDFVLPCSGQQHLCLGRN